MFRPHIGAATKNFWNDLGTFPNLGGGFPISQNLFILKIAPIWGEIPNNPVVFLWAYHSGIVCILFPLCFLQMKFLIMNTSYDALSYVSLQHCLIRSEQA